jgi:hypothetical protein
VARAISGNIFENQGSSWKFVDRGLISLKVGGYLQDGGDFPGPDLFSNGTSRWTRSTTHGPLAALVHSEPWPWLAEELIRAWPSGGSGARRLTDDNATERGVHEKSVLGLTGARVVVWHQGDGGEVVVKKGLIGCNSQAQGEGESEGRRYSESRRGRLPIIGAGRVVAVGLW